MIRARVLVVPLLLALGLAACAPPPGSRGQPEGGAQTGQPAPQRPLNVVLRNEPFDLTDTASSRNRITVALFVGKLANIDENDVPYPVLVESLPQLDTDSWKVSADGRMETTYRLRPNLTWHDGAPLTAEDFVFTHRATQTRMDWGLSTSSLSPVEHRAIAEVLAPDARTVVIRWRQPYPEAVAPEMKVVPRHILEPVMDQGVPEVLGAHPYWTTEYVGVGPFRVARWEQGAFIEGAAFDNYALGRPKIDRVRVTWSGDPNATVARLLAGDADITMDAAIQFQQAATLRREWGARNAGVVILAPREIRHLQGQHRPAYANPQSILDVRVRQAVLHAVDRRGMVEALLEGEGLVADYVAPPNVPYYADLERAAPKYPYDLRRTEQILSGLGFSRGADGVWVSPTEGRFSPQVMGIAEGQEGQETTIVVDFLRRVGIDAQLHLVPAAQLQQSDEMKATFPALRTNYTGIGKNLAADRFLGSRVAGPDNRWGGTNKIGWAHPEHDRVYDEWTKALDPRQRSQLMVQIARIHNEDLPALPMYFNFEIQAHAAALQGPFLPGLESTHYGNVHLWQWR